MYHATPARCAPPSGFSAVSSAPQSLPFAYITCCIRVSFESGLATTSGPFAWAAGGTSSFQQPVPAMVWVVSSFRQCPWGTAVAGAVPEPGCCCFGGTPYWPTVRILLRRLTAGLAVFSDAVFSSVHAMSWLEVRLPAAPETGFCASSAAFELRKFSVPLFARLNCDVPGDCAGQSVKPGCVEPASLGAPTMPAVSMCCIVTLAKRATRRARRRPRQQGRVAERCSSSTFLPCARLGPCQVFTRPLLSPQGVPRTGAHRFPGAGSARAAAARSGRDGVRAGDAARPPMISAPISRLPDQASKAQEAPMSFQAYLDNVEAKTGKTPQQFVDEAAAKGLTKHGEIPAWLKGDYGLGTGHARAVAHVIMHGPEFEVKQTSGTHRDESGTLRLDGKAERGK